MQPKYLIKNQNTGLVGQFLPVTKGENLDITLVVFNDDGTPMELGGTPTSISIKVFTSNGNSPITKTLLSSQVQAIESDQIGVFGFNFSLAAADTALMAANNSGLPMTITYVANGETTLLDFPSIFQVLAPTVT